VPIRLRLALLFALGTAVLVGVAGFVFAHQLSAGLVSSLDAGIRTRTDALARTLVSGPVPTAAADGTASPLASSLTQVIDSAGKVVAASGDAGQAPFLTATQRRIASNGPLAATVTLTPAGDSALAGERVRIRAVPVSVSGRTLVIVAASSRETVDDATTRVRHAVTFGGPPVVALAGLAAWLVAGGALRPVERMRREVADISEHGAETSIDIPRTRDEIASLAATMNDVLGRLKAALDRERRFVADAGHELRTPLTILQGELELAARPGRTAADLRATVDSATVEVRRLTALAEDLLTVGRQSTTSPRTEPVGLADLVRVATDGFATMAAEADVAFRLDVDETVTAQGDAAQLRRLVDNLLDNALRYAPRGTEVAILVGRQPGNCAVLEVRDQGPGFPSDFLPHAFERFRRADDARSQDGGGTGLGLAIVHEIVAVHGGRAVAANRPDGGAVVRLELLCPPPPPT
jgi:two-component system, OmpR family, sensor kinase